MRERLDTKTNVHGINTMHGRVRAFGVPSLGATLQVPHLLGIQLSHFGNARIVFECVRQMVKNLAETPQLFVAAHVIEERPECGSRLAFVELGARQNIDSLFDSAAVTAA